MQKATHKIFLSSLLVFSLSSYAVATNGNEFYSSAIKPVYADSSSQKVIGKLLPTNKFKLISKENSRLKIEVEGYLNPASPSVIYFSNGARIFSVAFAKTAKIDTKLIKKGENGAWDKVSVITYIDDGDLENSVDNMFNRADTLFKEACSSCHVLPDKKHYTANQWPSLLKSMINRTAIDKKDEWLIIEYLQKHSKDVDIKGENNE